MKLTDEQQQFFHMMETTFSTAGWTRLCKDWEGERTQIKEYLTHSAETIEDVMAARNRRGFLRELIEMGKSLEASKQAILDDDGTDNQYE